LKIVGCNCELEEGTFTVQVELETPVRFVAET